MMTETAEYPKNRNDVLDLQLDQAMVGYAQGRRGAFEELYRLLTPVVTRYLRRILTSEHRVKDALQTTFLKIHRARDSYMPGTSARAWALAVARNAALDQLRRKASSELSLDELAMDRLIDLRPNVMDDSLHQEDLALIRAAVEALPERSREVVRLHKLDEIPLADVAEQLGIRASTARVRAHRGYLRLRELLAGFAPPSANAA